MSTSTASTIQAAVSTIDMTSVVSTSLPSTLEAHNRPKFDNSTIAFGVVATILAVASVVVTYVQYRHLRKTASRSAVDTELGAVDHVAVVVAIEEALV